MEFSGGGGDSHNVSVKFITESNLDGVSSTDDANEKRRRRNDDDDGDDDDGDENATEATGLLSHADTHKDPMGNGGWTR
jgi:hypothetical protein